MLLKSVMQIAESREILEEDLGNLKQIDSDLRAILGRGDHKAPHGSVTWSLGQNSRIEKIDLKFSADVFRPLNADAQIVVIFKGGEQVAAVRQTGGGKFLIAVKKSFIESNKKPDERKEDEKRWKSYFDGWEPIRHDDELAHEKRYRRSDEQPADNRKYLVTNGNMGKVEMSSIVKLIMEYTGKTTGLAVYADKERIDKRNARSGNQPVEPVKKPLKPDDSYMGTSYQYQDYLRRSRDDLKKRLELYKGTKAKSFADVSEVKEHFTETKKFEKKIKVDGFIYLQSEYGNSKVDTYSLMNGIINGKGFKVEWRLEENSPKLVKIKAMIDEAKKAGDKESMRELAELLPPTSVIVNFTAAVASVKADGEMWTKREILKKEDEE